MDRSFYPRWIAANGWSEGIGLTTTLLIGFAVGEALETQPGTTAVIVGAVLAIVLGAALEGVLVGWAQGRVLHQAAPVISTRRWCVATAIGAAAAWLLGMVPSTVLALRDGGGDSSPPAEPPALVRMALALALGAVLGLVLAYPQTFELRRLTPKTRYWLVANALAWAVGMPLIFLGMDLVPFEGPLPLIGLSVAIVCGTAGATVGSIHGAFLRQAVAAPNSRQPSRGDQ